MAYLDARSTTQAPVLHGGASAPAAARPADARYIVDLVTGPGALDPFRRPIRDLAEKALAPAPGAGFAWSKAALDHLGSDTAGSGLALVWRHAAEDGNEDLTLVGAFAQANHPLVPGFSALQTRTWKHIFGFLGTPLLHEKHATQALTAYFDWVFGPANRASSLVFEQVPGTGPFAATLNDVVARRAMPVRVLAGFERAMLEVPPGVDDYLAASLPRKRRKEFRRLKARLGELGALRLSCFARGDDLQRWLNDFYALEGRGWKGRAQTSLSCDPAWTGFFDTAYAAFDDAGEALIWKLCLDGAPVAMMLGAKDGRRAWLHKIAFDEAYARFSPGVLLVLEIMNACAESGDIDTIDSCAQSDHPMINQIFRERLALQDVLVGRPSQSAPAFAASLAATRLRRDGREAAKRIYHKFIKGGAK